MHSYKMSFVWSSANLYLSTSGDTWNTLIFPGLKPSSKQTFLANPHSTFDESELSQQCPSLPYTGIFGCRTPCSPSCACAGLVQDASPRPRAEHSGGTSSFGQRNGTEQVPYLPSAVPQIVLPPHPLRGASLPAEGWRPTEEASKANRQGQEGLAQSPALCVWPRAQVDTGTGGGTRTAPGEGEGEGQAGQGRQGRREQQGKQRKQGKQGRQAGREGGSGGRALPSLRAGRAQPPPPALSLRRHRDPSRGRRNGNGSVSCLLNQLLGFEFRLC